MAKGESKIMQTTYLLETKNGQQRKVTVPSNWRVTFGPTVPFERKSSGNYNELWALRFYDGKDLKAIFTDVKSFRDTGIAIEEKRVKTQRQTVQRAGAKGGKSIVAEAKIEQWVNPDDPEEDITPTEFLKLDFDPEEEI